MPAPSFSESGRGKQFIHQVGIGLRILIREKCLHLYKTWFEPKQVMIKTPDQGFAMGGGRWSQVLRRESLADKEVDRLGRRWFFGKLWHPDGLESPMIRGLFEHLLKAVRGTVGHDSQKKGMTGEQKPAKRDSHDWTN